MKPYYEHKGIVIYHGDCREVLPQLPENCADLVVTDPPYGVRWQSGLRQKQFDVIAGDESREAAEVAIPLCFPVLKRGRHIYVFGRYDFSGHAISDPVELIWDKEMLGPGDLRSPWGKQHEYIQFFCVLKSQENKKDGDGRLSARLRRGTVLRCPRLNSIAIQLHPTEKPVNLIRQLIESSSCLGETVLDPFMGSGSSLEAARAEGRNFIGVEIEERYCEIAAKRLSQEVLSFDTREQPSSTLIAGRGPEQITLE